MSYADYNDFKSRYDTRLAESEINSHYLHFASIRLETALAEGFTTPFSANNVTATDLVLDLAYLLILQRSREPGEYKPLEERVSRRLEALRSGKEAMVTNSGETLFAQSPNGDIWSNHQDHTPVFGLGEPVSEIVDPDRVTEEEA